MRYLLFVLAGCGFSAHGASDAAPGHDTAAAGDGPHVTDGAMTGADAMPEPAFMLASSSSGLYQIDVVAQTATFLAGISDGSVDYTMYGLAGTATRLYGIPSTDDHVMAIDPTTGMVSGSMPIAKHTFYGMTYIPPGDPGGPVYLAGTDASGEPAGVAHLYAIDPATGSVTSVGPFGGSLVIAGDLAWVHTRGLYGSFYGPGCTPTCVGTIDPSTGAVTVLTYTAPANLLAMSGFHSRLWALSNVGRVYELDPGTGAVLSMFDTSIAFADAAM